MPQYKLHYFNGRGRGELSRLILAVADVKYEDIRYDFKDWPAAKPNFRFQQLPVLEVDGQHLNQSMAIAHYLAREHNLTGKTTLHDGQCLALAEQIKDLFDGLVDFKFRETDELAKAAKKKAYEEGMLKSSLTALEAHFKEHMSASGYLVGNDLTWADLAAFEGFELLQVYLQCEDLLTGYPTLAAHRSAMRNLPRIKKYLESRPKTDF